MEETEAGVANGPISLVAMIGFHHTKGHITEWVYPAPVSGEGDFRHLAMLCLPEGAHTVEGLGHVFFTIELALAPVGPKQMYYGVSIFGQVKTAEVLGMVRGAGDKSENKRAVVQKAVAALGREPSFWWLHSRLRPAAQDLFTRKDFSRVAVLQDVVRTAGPESMEECVASIERHPDLSEAQLLLVQRFGRNTLLLFKLLLLEPRLVLFAAGCAEASSLVLALVSLVSRLLHSFSPALQLSMSLPAPGGHDGAAGRAACRSAGGPRLTPTTPVSIRQRLQEHASACSPERKLSPPSASPSVEDDSAPFSAASPMGEDNGGGVWGVAATSVQNHSSTSVGVNGGTSGGPRERAASINAPLPAALQEGIHSGSAPSGLQQAEKKEQRDRKPRLQILPPEVVGGGSESCEGGVNEDMRMHGLPLRIFHSRNHMEPYLPMELLAQSRPCGPAPGSAQQGSVQTGSGQGTGGRGGQGERIAGGQSDELPSATARLGGSFLVGSSNRMFLLPANPSQLDVVADAETGQVHVLSERLGRAANLSVHERQVADALVHLVAQHTHTVRRAREAREEAAVSSHMAAAAAAAEVVAGGGCVQHSFGAAAAGFAAEDAAVMADSVKSMAETVREELARYLLRLLQAAARHAATAIWSPDSLSRDLAVNEMPRVHGAEWTKEWQATSNYQRWLAEHDPTIAHHSKALVAAVKDTMKAGLLDMRQSLRASVGANLGIRHAMKSKFSFFLSEFSTATAAMSPPRAEAPGRPRARVPQSAYLANAAEPHAAAQRSPPGLVHSLSTPVLSRGGGVNFSADDAALLAGLRSGLLTSVGTAGHEQGSGLRCREGSEGDGREGLDDRWGEVLTGGRARAESLPRSASFPKIELDDL